MENPVWFQKLFYKETVLAIKSSLDFLCFENFKNDLFMLLPNESKKSKTRIANNILHRFFPDKKLYGFLPQIWETYKDEILLQEIIRHELLKQEPVIADFYINNILTKQPGEKLSPEIFNDYIKITYGKEIKNLTFWLQSTLRDLGFISKSGSLWQVNDIRIPETAFILLLHKILIPYPQEISLKSVYNEILWSLIGIRDIDTVKNIINKAYLLNILEYNNSIIKTNYPLESLFTVLKGD